ncbi:hypothetical protein BKA65DRAFT_44687 [Rhexocercosporidium sp. MPI-PUGE-AT-0058]|nr:hypothetical protein BKA65DRAFT_44687 [Rhexocercosporidium sp. MPI-PUGE-AT-0058]
MPDGMSSDARRKRKRLTFACNRCRSRKVRCDERQPDCTNCAVAGTVCVTQNPRQPFTAVQRREAQADSRRGSPPPSYVGHGHASPQSSLRPEIHLAAIPGFAAGSSVDILTQWLDLAFARIGHPRRVVYKYKDILASFNRSLLSTSQISPELILEQFRIQGASIHRFLSTVNLIFPICGIGAHDDVRQDATYYVDKAVAGERIGLITTVHCLLLAASSTCTNHGQRRLMYQCLKHVVENLGSMMMSDSLEAVVIMLLSAIVARGCNQTVMARHLLGLGISVALAQGINRPPASFKRSSTPTVLERQRCRIWACLYILDKILSVELERPGLIRNFDFNSITISTMIDRVGEPSHSASGHERVFQAVVDLARLQNQVVERLRQSRHEHETANLAIGQVITETIGLIGVLDQQLLTWSEKLPPDIRPSELSLCDPPIQAAVSFLALQFYQTIFLLHRNALIVSAKEIQDEIDANFKHAPYRLRIERGLMICSTTARAIVNNLNYMNDNDFSSVLVSIHAPLVAICAISVQLLRNRTAQSVRADLEMQASAIQSICNQLIAPSEHEIGLEDSLWTLHREVTKHLDKVRGGSGKMPVPTASSSLSVHSNGSGYNIREASVGPQVANSADPEDQNWERYAWNSGDSLDGGFIDNTLNTGLLDWDSLAVLLDLPHQQ